MGEQFTTEEALKIELEGVKEQLKKTTDALEQANEKLAKKAADDAERLKVDILERTNLKAADLEGKSIETLNAIKLGLDRAGVTSKAAGIKKSSDERKATDGLTVGRWDPATKTYVGGL